MFGEGDTLGVQLQGQLVGLLKGQLWRTTPEPDEVYGVLAYSGFEVEPLTAIWPQAVPTLPVLHFSFL